MNVLITHECSGRVREAFLDKGHSAWSCDLKPAEDDGPHICRDAIEAMRTTTPWGDSWNFIGMHCECTYLTVSGLHWNGRIPGRAAKTEAAKQHVLDCIAAATATGAKWYLENSIGLVSTFYRKPDQIIQPYRFGEDASKATCLWLSGLRPLRELDMDLWAKPRWVCRNCKRVSTHEDSANWKDKDGRRLCHRCDGCPPLLPRWANQTDSGQNKLAPSEHRAADRARTYLSIAKAMAAQWGKLP